MMIAGQPEQHVYGSDVSLLLLKSPNSLTHNKVKYDSTQQAKYNRMCAAVPFGSDLSSLLSPNP